MYIPVAPGISSDLEDLSAKRQPHRKRSMMRSQCGHANVVDVDLKITKSENLKRRQKEVCPLMTGTALDQETMETWLDVIPLLEVGRALVSRRRTCLRALRSLYHLTAQNICRSRWPCDRRPLYVLERRWIVHHRSSTGFAKSGWVFIPCRVDRVRMAMFAKINRRSQGHQEKSWLLLNARFF